jgi:hypothetical protein
MKNKMKQISLKPENAIERRAHTNGRKYFLFKCGTVNCSNTLSVGAAPCQLKRATGYCTSCHRKKRPYGIIFNRIAENSKQKSIPNSLTYSQFLEFTKVKVCVYCEELVEWMEHIPAHYRGHYGYNLDRKDSSKGYSKENCVVCCKICNWSKNELFSHEEFLEIGKTIGKILRKRRS